MREYYKSDIIRLSKQVELCVPVVYFLIHEDEIVYVGFTNNIHFRLAAHKADKMFDRFYTIEFETKEEGLLFEKQYIKKFKPLYNRMYNDEALMKREKALLLEEKINYIKERKTKSTTIVNKDCEVNELIKTSEKYNLLKNTFCKRVINGVNMYLINLNGDYYLLPICDKNTFIHLNSTYSISGNYGEIKNFKL